LNANPEKFKFLNFLFIKNQLKEIFEYRKNKLIEIFGEIS